MYLPFSIFLSLYIYIYRWEDAANLHVRSFDGSMVFGVSTPPGDGTVHARRGTRGSGEPRKRRRCRGRRTTLLWSFGFYPVVENRCM